MPFINFNTITPGIVHPDFVKAQEVTRDMGDYLDKNYTLTDHRNDKNYSTEWNTALAYYNQEANAAYMQKESSLYSYLQLMNNPNYITIVSAKDDAASNIDDTVTSKLQLLGFKEDLRGKTGYSYLGIVDGGTGIRTESKPGFNL